MKRRTILLLLASAAVTIACSKATTTASAAPDLRKLTVDEVATRIAAKDGKTFVYDNNPKESWAKANPDAAGRLRTALERATKYLDTASKEERDEWIAKYTGVKLEVVREIHLPLYVTEFNVSTLQANLDILVRQKLTKPFDVNAMIWKP